MKHPTPNITVPVDLTNPGQFFACCGLLELADRLWPGAEGWFKRDQFHISCGSIGSTALLLGELARSGVSNTMASMQLARLDQLSAMKRQQRESQSGLEDEKKALESLRRELPIEISGPVTFLIDWFRDDLAGGSRFKTWAGKQSVLDIATSMHAGIGDPQVVSESTLWAAARGIGLPFNFDSDLGGQGSALDIGFSFDPLAGSETTRIQGTCKPVLEFLCFIGLQRFRPCEIPRENRFVYTAWGTPLSPAVASAVACGAARHVDAPRYEFKLLYRTKYLKSFLPSIPFQGDRDE